MRSKIHVIGETYFGVIVGSVSWALAEIYLSVYTKTQGDFAGWQARVPWFIWVGAWLGAILLMRTAAWIVTSIYAAEDERLRK